MHGSASDILHAMPVRCGQLEVTRFEAAAIEKRFRQVSSRTEVDGQSERQCLDAAPLLLLIKSLSLDANDFEARCTARG